MFNKDANNKSWKNYRNICFTHTSSLATVKHNVWKIQLSKYELVRRDPREPGIFKINSTQWFFK
jgi:hypothetical protein